MKPIQLILMLCLLLLAGCAHPISKGLRHQVDPALSFHQLLLSPDTHVGKKVVLGGIIVETRNLKNVTEIEVVEKELDCFGYPEFGDESRGRFVFRKPGYLEAAIYTKGRMVTGGGTLVATQSGKIGEVEYEFPVIAVEELKLWDAPAPGYGYPRYGPYGARWGPYPYNPFYFNRIYGPWYYPYFW